MKKGHILSMTLKAPWNPPNFSQNTKFWYVCKVWLLWQSTNPLLSYQNQRSAPTGSSSFVRQMECLEVGSWSMAISVSLEKFSNKLLVRFWVTDCWQSDNKLFFGLLVSTFSWQTRFGRRDSLGYLGVSCSSVRRSVCALPQRPSSWGFAQEEAAVA